MSTGPIKTCPMCGTVFFADCILRDPSVRPIGIQLDDADMSYNSYFFNHEVTGCGTTFTIQVERLRDFVAGRIPVERLSGTLQCEGHCGNVRDRAVCGQDCHYAPFRRLLHYMLEIRGLARESGRTGSVG